MGNPVVGTCRCPLCGDEDAEVRQGEKGRVYVVCDACVSNIRTLSRHGHVSILALMKAQDNPAPKPAAVDPDPAPAPPAPPAPAPKAKPKTPSWMKPWEKPAA